MSTRTRIVRRPFAVGNASVDGRLHAFDDRRVEAARQLRLLDLDAHDVAQLRTAPAGSGERGRSCRVADPVDPFEGRDEQLVLLGVREDLDLVDGHAAGMVEDATPQGQTG